MSHLEITEVVLIHFNIVNSDYQQGSLHKKWSFPLGISLVNVTKLTGICGFDHINWRNP